MTTITREDLVGVWDLVRYFVRLPDGTELAPLGDDAVGRIGYTADGYMFGFMARARRAPFASVDRLLATPAEKAAAFDDCVSYAGRWTLREDGLVVHHIEVSLLPNWTGQAQLRIPVADEQGLELVAHVGEGAARRSAIARWRRASGAIWAAACGGQGADLGGPTLQAAAGECAPQGAMSTSPITASS
ncbi:MAG: lipocalin-like domain-containing protein [Rubrivivax sp.]